MAAVVGANVQVFGHETPAGSQQEFSDGVALLTCFLSIGSFTGTYVQGTGFTVNAATAIQNSRRDGKTVTPYSAMFVAPGKENGAVEGLGPGLTVTSPNITGLITQADGSTERAASAMNALFDKPFVIAVTYKLANPE